MQRDAKLTSFVWNFVDLVEGHQLQLTNNADKSRTFAGIYMHENKLYIIEGTVPAGYPEPGLFQQSLGWLDENGVGLRYQTYYSNGFPPPPRVNRAGQGQRQGQGRIDADRQSRDRPSVVDCSGSGSLSGTRRMSMWVRDDRQAKPSPRAAGGNLRGLRLPAGTPSHGAHEETFWIFREVGRHLVVPIPDYLEVKDAKGERRYGPSSHRPHRATRIASRRIRQTDDIVKARYHLKDGSNGCLLGFLAAKDGTVKDWDGNNAPAPTDF